jgi:hypothetical protein
MAARKKLVSIKAIELKEGDTLVSCRQLLSVTKVTRTPERTILVALAFGQLGSELLHEYELEDDLEISA